jgi:hypothetical protein
MGLFVSGSYQKLEPNSSIFRTLFSESSILALTFCYMIFVWKIILGIKNRLPCLFKYSAKCVDGVVYSFILHYSLNYFGLK